ncbi:MAG: MFS transporter [Pseudomonadota bacterium]
MIQSSTQSNNRQALIILGGGFIILAVGFGVRTSFGIVLPNIGEDTGWSISMLSLAFAVQSLMWGVTQPFAGAFSDMLGPRKTFFLGGLVYASGLGLMAISWEPVTFTIGAGVLIGAAQSALGFPILLGAILRTAPKEKQGLYSGIATAGGAFGQFAFAPLSHMLNERIHWIDTMLVMAIICLGVSLLALLVLPAQTAPEKTPQTQQPDLRRTLQIAMRHKPFLLLIMGFFVCGFQLAFITVHMPGFVATTDVPTVYAAYSLSIIGLANIVGCIVAGYLGGRMRPKFPLSVLYFLRTLAIAALMLTPVTPLSIIMFSVAMGLLWLSTIPLTNGVVAQMFGNKFVGMLYGIVFLNHQIGSFIGVWVGGILFDITGSFTIIWWLTAALGVIATLLHLPIDDRRVSQFAEA